MLKAGAFFEVADGELDNGVGAVEPGGYGPVLRSVLTPQNIGLVPVVRRVASSVGPAGALLS